MYLFLELFIILNNNIAIAVRTSVKFCNNLDWHINEIFGLRLLSGGFAIFEGSEFLGAG